MHCGQLDDSSEVLLPIARFWSNAVLAKNGFTRNVTPLYPERPGVT